MSIGRGEGAESPSADPPPIALTIAGSDSGGGAGIQADLKTFHQFGVFGTCVVVAVTAQNTRSVSDVQSISADVVKNQMAALAEDLPPRAVKTGMLSTKDLVLTVAQGIREFGFPRAVVDPVMVATSGDRLLSVDAERALVDELFPLAALVTPNLIEASALVHGPVNSESDMERAGRAMLDMGARAALIKGLASDAEFVDMLVTPEGATRFSHARLPARSTHGTGCTLSAAITAGLATGTRLGDAIGTAIDFVQRAIAAAPAIGSGHHPLNHFVAAHPLST